MGPAAAMSTKPDAATALIPSASALVREEPSRLERASLHQLTHVGVATSVILSLMVSGVAFFPAVLLAGLATFGGVYWMVTRPIVHFRKGHYRRALALTRKIRDGGWLVKAHGDWQLVEAVCLIALGENERAKELLHTAKSADLSRQASHARVLDLAILYCRITEPQSALTILDELDPTGLPPFFRANYHAIRASAQFLKEADDEALAELNRAREVGLPRELEPGCLSLTALVAYEGKGDREGAIAMSRKAVAALPEVDALRAPVIVNHAYLVLDCTGDIQAALDAVGQAVGHETELGASGRALYHYVLARCYVESRMLADVREHLDEALEQPVSPRLRRRIEHLDEQVRSGRALLTSDE